MKIQESQQLLSFFLHQQICIQPSLCLQTQVIHTEIIKHLFHHMAKYLQYWRVGGGRNQYSTCSSRNIHAHFACLSQCTWVKSSSAAHFFALREAAQFKYPVVMCPSSHDLESLCYQFNNSCSIPVQYNCNRRTFYGGIPSKVLSRKVAISERALTIRTRILHQSPLSRGISQF